jgi:hypothetical protein
MNIPYNCFYPPYPLVRLIDGCNYSPEHEQGSIWFANKLSANRVCNEHGSFTYECQRFPAGCACIRNEHEHA